MRSLDAGNDLSQQGRCPMHVQSSFAAQKLIESLALDIFHYQEENAVRAFPEVRYVNNIWMANRSSGARLALEPCNCFSFLQVFVGEYARSDSFHSHLAGHKVLIAREINLTHGATTQPLLQQVTSCEQGSAGQCVFSINGVLWTEKHFVFEAVFTAGALTHVLNYCSLSRSVSHGTATSKHKGLNEGRQRTCQPVTHDHVQATFRSAQQAAQRLAGMGMELRQKGHSFVAGVAVSLRLLMALTMRKITKAIIRKLTMSLMKAPYPITAKPLVLASATEAGCWPEISMNKFEKSTFPSTNPIGGMMTPSTRDVTILPNAAPIMTAIARSITFPRAMNSRNSFSMDSSFGSNHFLT